MKGFEALAQCFDQSAQAHQDACVTRHYSLAGRSVRIRTVGGSLANEIERPFSHLRSAVKDSGSPALEIDLVDLEETRVIADEFLHALIEGGHPPISTSMNGRFVLRSAPSEQMTSAFDRRARRIVAAVRDTSRLSLYERGRPLHTFLLLWLRDNGVQPVHAGLVSRAGSGILFGGAGGSGKSTVALTCLKAGFLYQGDDYIGSERNGQSFVGHSIYGSTHIEPSHLRRFPWLAPYARPGSSSAEEKSLVLLSEVRPESLSSAAPIDAIALPIVTNRSATSIRPASQADALLRLAPSSILQLPFATAVPGALQGISDLVESAPAFWLELGQDLDTIPKRVDEILQGVGR